MGKNEIKNYLEKLSVEELWENLTYKQRNGIYNRMSAQYVKEDVLSQCKMLKISIDDIHVNKIVNRYVYQCDYDNEVSYWDNLENLIKEVIKDD